MTITCPVNDTSGICSIMDAAGAGLGIFVQYMATALPPLLVILAIVGVIVSIGSGIGYMLKRKVSEH